MSWRGCSLAGVPLLLFILLLSAAAAIGGDPMAGGAALVIGLLSLALIALVAWLPYP